MKATIDPITAGQLATGARERAEALDVLREHRKVAFSWRYLAYGGAGALWGWLVAGTAERSPLILSVAAGAALFLAIGAFREAVRMKRRLDAIVTLVLNETADREIR